VLGAPRIREERPMSQRAGTDLAAALVPSDQAGCREILRRGSRGIGVPDAQHDVSMPLQGPHDVLLPTPWPAVWRPVGAPPRREGPVQDAMGERERGPDSNSPIV